MCIKIIHGSAELLIRHSHITDCGFCEEKESYQLVLFIKFKKTNKYMYTAPIECNTFLCSCACSV